MNKVELVIVISEHRFFGWKFSIHSATPVTNGSIAILGGADMESVSAGGDANKDIVKIIQYSNDMSDEALMKDYSRHTSILEFQKGVSQDVTERYIRPRIEMLNNKIAKIAQKINIPVYMRIDLSSKALYEHHSLSFFPSPTRCLFNFIKDEKDGFKYFISLTGGGENISLRTKTGYILSEKPCLVLLERTIYNVEEIEAKKLTPFFAKDSIPVSAQMEETYLKTFVFKTMQSYDVNIQGIPNRELKPKKKAFLSLERDFNKKETLILSFQYENAARIYPGSSMKKVIGLETTVDGRTGIWWYQRDVKWENDSIDALLGQGLVQKGNHFYGRRDMQYELIEWVNVNKELLSRFTLEVNMEQRYYIGPASVNPSIEMKIDWFDIYLEVTVGQFTLPLQVFKHNIIAGIKEYVLPDNTVFILPDEWFEKYQDILTFSETDKDGKGPLRLKKLYTSILDSALKGSIKREEQMQIDDILNIPVERPELPPNTASLLRPYQKDGFYWMHHLYRYKFGGCLADDMGLGKTLQTITLLQYVYRKGKDEGDGAVVKPSLVVAPTSLLHNWKNELKRFAPELTCLVYAGSDRIRATDATRIFHFNQVIITSYGTMRNDVELLNKIPFQIIVLDESQYIKNPESLTCKAVMQLNGQYRLALTGTPLENSLEDLWAQFNFINKGLLGSLDSFGKRFVQPIIRDRSAAQEAMLKRTIGPFLLRRTKEEVTPELPPLIEEVLYCDMSDAQAEVYSAEKNRIRNLIIEAKDSPGLPFSNFMALEALNKLRQLSNHPAMVIPDYTEDSGKFEQIILSFESLKKSGHKALFFSSYVKYLKLLAKRFEAEGWKYAMLTGETKNREEEINSFINSKDIHSFFISLKAGATGLNLTAADYVFILDPWWNPAVEMQALSRAHRIGQNKTVMAFRFISTNTIEEKMIQLQQSKSALFDTFINNNNPLDKFTWDDFEKLVD